MMKMALEDILVKFNVKGDFLMPDKDNEQQQPRLGMIRKIAGALQSNIDSLYKSVHYSEPNAKQQLINIRTDVNATIKDIMTATSDSIGQPNISKLFERFYLTGKGTQGDLSKDFERIFGDNQFVSNLTASYLDNRWVRAVDIEIDEVCKYMPKLQEALDVVTDNILSADSFNKDYLNLQSVMQDTSISQEQFARNIEDLKEQYDLLKLIKQIYKQTSKYGETYVYRVPYDRAIQRLIDRKAMVDGNTTTSVKANESGIIFESTVAGRQVVPYVEANGNKTSLYGAGDFACNIYIEDGIISSIVETEQHIRKRLSVVSEQAIFTEAYRNGQQYDIDSRAKAYAYDDTINRVPIEYNGQLPTHKRLNQTLGDHIELPDYAQDTTADGFVSSDQKQPMIKSMNGCIVKILRREQVVPIILNKVCLGYYYFEFDTNVDMFNERLSTTGLVNTLTGVRSNQRVASFDAIQRREELLRSISNELAKKIDIKFIDQNQDLKKEIYHILKYNDEFNAAAVAGTSNNIRVSYIPPDDIIHFYFELDEITGRGISDLNLSLIPAKLWVAITMCNCIGIMTRSNDKRVYYVRNNVETNIANAMRKALDEIKKGNFGIRQIENINSVLNITGRFNDYIIPRGPDGNAPVDFEILPGQQIEIKTELLSILEELAINPIGVPLDLIQQRQSPDYAMQFTMSSSKFLRFVYDRQSDFAKQASKLITDIYDLEYGTKDRIILQLPPPLFINMTNTNQLFDNTRGFCQNLTELYMAGEQDDLKKQLFTKKLVMRRLGAYLNADELEDLAKQVDQEAAAAKIAEPGEDTSGGSGGF